MQIISYLIALLIVFGAGFAGYKYLTSRKGLEQTEEEEIIIEKPTIDKLVEITAKTVNSFLRMNFTNQNLTRAEFDNKTKAKARMRRDISDAAYGDVTAKARLRETIKGIITTNSELIITEENITEFIPFDDPALLSPQDKFYVILQGYTRHFQQDGLVHMFNELGWGDGDIVTDEMVNEVYDILLDPARCRERDWFEDIISDSYNDRLDFIVQEVFQRYVGFGTADRLFESTIDEIDGGVSGIPAGSFELNNAMMQNAKYSYDSIWILFHGHNIHLECLSFGSEEEIERVCDNVYKYNAQRVFSRAAGYVVSSMKNGSRVVVTRPPMSDKFAFYVRKFDSAPSIEPERIVIDDGRDIPLTLCKWFIKGQRNIAITGQQGTGKTTMLKSFMRWIENLNIRTQELAFEMNLSFSYPEKNISSFQETDSVSAQEGLNVQKKTNGAVNIVGEVANAEQASHVIQTANVASLFAMFTHHAKTTYALVSMIALNLLQMGLYKEKRDAIEISAETLNIDVHLENIDGHRCIARICEIIPVVDQLYPSEKIQMEYKEKHGTDLPYSNDLSLLDTREFYKRQTDRQLFEVNKIVEWHLDTAEDARTKGFFTLENMPSRAMMDEIRARLINPKLKAEFDADMEKVQKLDEEVRARHGLTPRKVI